MRFSGRAMLLTALLVITSCGGAASPAPNAANGFPADVQPLLQGLPANVVQALLDVRKSGPGTLIWHDSGGEEDQGFARAFRDNWAKITGWTAQGTTTGGDNSIGSWQTQIDSGHPQWDVGELGSGGDALLAQQKNDLELLDPNLMAYAYSHFPKGYMQSPYYLSYGYTDAILIWNTNVWPLSGKHPTTALDLFNTTDFPGPRCMFKYPWFAGTLEFPLLADGVPASQVYPINMTRALAKLDTIKKNIVWWDSGANSIQYVLNGQCDLGITWNGRPGLRLRDEPTLPLAATWKDGWLFEGLFAIPKGAPHKLAAMSALAYMYTAQNQCRLLDTLGYGLPLDDSCLTDYSKKWGAIGNNAAQAALLDNPQDYVDQMSTLLPQFNAWLTK